MSPGETTYEGQCYCGAVKIEVTGDAVGAGYCHFINNVAERFALFETAEIVGKQRDQRLNVSVGETLAQIDSDVIAQQQIRRPEPALDQRNGTGRRDAEHARSSLYPHSG